MRQSRRIGSSAASAKPASRSAAHHVRQHGLALVQRRHRELRLHHAHRGQHPRGPGQHPQLVSLHVQLEQGVIAGREVEGLLVEAAGRNAGLGLRHGLREQGGEPARHRQGRREVVGQPERQRAGAIGQGEPRASQRSSPAARRTSSACAAGMGSKDTILPR